MDNSTFVSFSLSLCLNYKIIFDGGNIFFFSSENVEFYKSVCHYVWNRIQYKILVYSENVELCNLFSLSWPSLRDGCPRCKARVQANFFSFMYWITLSKKTVISHKMDYFLDLIFCSKVHICDFGIILFNSSGIRWQPSTPFRVWKTGLDCFV